MKLSPHEKRLIPLPEVAKEYPEEAKLAKLFFHDVIEDNHGTWRWRRNSMVDYLVMKEEIIDLNELHVAIRMGRFQIEEYVKFYMQMGYSLCGFREVFSQSEAVEWGLDGKKRTDDDDPDEYVETVTSFLLRKYAGRAAPLVI